MNGSWSKMVDLPQLPEHYKWFVQVTPDGTWIEIRDPYERALFSVQYPVDSYAGSTKEQYKSGVAHRASLLAHRLDTYLETQEWAKDFQ